MNQAMLFNFKIVFLSCSEITESFLRSVIASVQYSTIYCPHYDMYIQLYKFQTKLNIFKQFFI
jgi:hypothetical protein